MACGKERNFSGEHFWARGYVVSTVGFELEQVRQYIRKQQQRTILNRTLRRAPRGRLDQATDRL
jgi:hypothetical protein